MGLDREIVETGETPRSRSVVTMARPNSNNGPKNRALAGSRSTLNRIDSFTTGAILLGYPRVCASERDWVTGKLENDEFRRKTPGIATINMFFF